MLREMRMPVWADWLRLATAGVIKITATTRRQGDRLVTNIVIPLALPTEVVNLKLCRIDLQERPDGYVAVLLPPLVAATIGSFAADPDLNLAVLSVLAPESFLIIAGINDKTAFGLYAPSPTLSLERVVPARRLTGRSTSTLPSLTSSFGIAWT